MRISPLFLLITLAILMSALTRAATPVIYNLGTLGGTESYGRAVNDARQVEGYSQITESLTLHAFRYDGTPGSRGVMRDWDTLGGETSYGFGINSAGQVAGSSTTGVGTFAHAFLYTGTPGAAGQILTSIPGSTRIIKPKALNGLSSSPGMSATPAGLPATASTTPTALAAPRPPARICLTPVRWSMSPSRRASLFSLSPSPRSYSGLASHSF